MQSQLQYQNSAINPNRNNDTAYNNYLKSNDFNQKLPSQGVTGHRPLIRTSADNKQILDITASTRNHDTVEKNKPMNVYPSLTAFETPSSEINQYYPASDKAKIATNSNNNEKYKIQSSNNAVNHNLYGFLSDNLAHPNDGNTYGNSPTGAPTNANNINASDANYYHNFINRNSSSNNFPNENRKDPLPIDKSNKEANISSRKQSSDSESDHEWEAMLSKYTSPIQVNEKPDNLIHSALSGDDSTITSNSTVSHSATVSQNVGQVHDGRSRDMDLKDSSSLSNAWDIDDILPTYDIESLKSNFNAVPTQDTSISTNTMTIDNLNAGSLPSQVPHVNNESKLQVIPADIDHENDLASSKNVYSPPRTSMANVTGGTKMLSSNDDVAQALASFGNNDNNTLDNIPESNINREKSETVSYFKQSNVEGHTTEIVKDSIETIVDNTYNNSSVNICNKMPIETSNIYKGNDGTSTSMTNQIDNFVQKQLISYGKKETDNSNTYNNISNELDNPSSGEPVKLSSNGSHTSDKLLTNEPLVLSFNENSTNNPANINDSSSKSRDIDITTINDQFSNVETSSYQGGGVSLNQNLQNIDKETIKFSAVPPPTDITSNSNSTLNGENLSRTNGNTTHASNELMNLQGSSNQQGRNMDIPKMPDNNQVIKNSIDSSSKSTDESALPAQAVIGTVNYDVFKSLDNALDKTSLNVNDQFQSKINDNHNQVANNIIAITTKKELSGTSEIMISTSIKDSNSTGKKIAEESSELDNLILDPFYEVKKRDTADQNLDSNDLSSLLDISFNTVVPGTSNDVSNVSVAENPLSTVTFSNGDDNLRQQQAIVDITSEQQLLTDKPKVIDEGKKSFDGFDGELLDVGDHPSSQRNLIQTQNPAGEYDLLSNKDGFPSQIQSMDKNSNSPYTTTNIHYGTETINDNKTEIMDREKIVQTANNNSKISTVQIMSKENNTSDSNLTEDFGSNNIPAIDDLLSGVINELNNEEAKNQETGDKVTSVTGT